MEMRTMYFEKWVRYLEAKFPQGKPYRTVLLNMPLLR